MIGKRHDVAHRIPRPADHARCNCAVPELHQALQHARHRPGLLRRGHDLEQVELFAEQAAAADICPIEHLVVTGGEPLLHPQVEQIVDLLDRRLVQTGRVLWLEVNSNLILPCAAGDRQTRGQLQPPA